MGSSRQVLLVIDFYHLKWVGLLTFRLSPVRTVALLARLTPSMKFLGTGLTPTAFVLHNAPLVHY